MKRVLIGLGLLLGIAAVAVIAFLVPRTSAPLTTLESLRERYATPASKYVDVAGVQVHYHDEGSGPPVVLLHGSFGSLQTWDEFATALGGRYRLIRYDQPPGGLSGPVPKDFSMTMEEFLHAFLGRIGVSKVAVVGTSSGGIIAYRYAATYPDDVTAVVLTNVPPSAPVDNAGARGRLSWYSQLSTMACAKYAKPWSRTCWADFLDSMFLRKEGVTDALVQKYFDMNRRPDARQMTSMTALMKDDAKVRDFLSRVRAPTLLVWSQDDPVLPPRTVETMASRLTGAKVEKVLLDDVSHYPPLEAPREVAAATDAFLKKTLTPEARPTP
jgi:pimeloyl-ACP methyl ester carboxylesterase